MKNKQIKWGAEILKAKSKTKRNEEAGKTKQLVFCSFCKVLKVSISEIAIFS